MASVTKQDLADARLALALEILQSPNAPQIVSAMQDLTMMQAHAAAQHKRHGNKDRARMWKHAADEFFTVMMCAVYQQADAMRGETDDDLTDE